MSKNDRLFIAILLLSLIMVGMIMTDNINYANTTAASTVNPQGPSAARQEILNLKLPLHEALYWKNTRE
ncbi:MAG: hypothetical protein V2A70_07290 [Candidatus Omnitrophota bacterium]